MSIFVQTLFVDFYELLLEYAVVADADCEDFIKPKIDSFRKPTVTRKFLKIFKVIFAIIPGRHQVRKEGVRKIMIEYGF